MASELIDQALLDFSNALEDSSLKRLFAVWKSLHAKRVESANATQSAAVEAATERLAALAGHLPAKTVEDALYKLAFWRWEMSAAGTDIAAMRPADRIVYSVFRDLAALTGETSVLTDADHRLDALGGKT
ncbi:MAG: hypothetical protein K2Q06_12790 [Parvularculaceae bacterium]|nr:hypothetical protein [Parvularculaceae bacterium]